MKMIFSDSRGSFWKIIHGQFSPIGAMTTLQLFENHISSAKAMIARKRQVKQISDCDKFEAPFGGNKVSSGLLFAFRDCIAYLPRTSSTRPVAFVGGKAFGNPEINGRPGKIPMHFAISRYRSHFAKFGLRERERDNQTFFERYARATFCRQLDKEGSKSRERERSDAVPYRLRTAPCFHSRSTFISNLASLWNARSLEPFSRPGWHKRRKSVKGREETGEMSGREKETIFARSSQPRNPVDPRISKRKGNRKVARNKARGEERASPCEIITFPSGRSLLCLSGSPPAC